MGLLSENRKEEGLMLNRSVMENMTLTRLQPFARAGFAVQVRPRRRSGRGIASEGILAKRGDAWYLARAQTLAAEQPFAELLPHRLCFLDPGCTQDARPAARESLRDRRGGAEDVDDDPDRGGRRLRRREGDVHTHPGYASRR